MLIDFKTTLLNRTAKKYVFDLVKKQLQLLHIDYIDLYMLHSPIDGDGSLQAVVWAAIHELMAAGLIRSAGVSNFSPREILQLMEKGAPKPAVLQNKFDLYRRGKQWDSAGGSVLSFCREQGITLMGYSPLDSFPFVLQVLYLSVKSKY